MHTDDSVKNICIFAAKKEKKETSNNRHAFCHTNDFDKFRLIGSNSKVSRGQTSKLKSDYVVAPLYLPFSFSFFFICYRSLLFCTA
jgi:hypothetical protein